jgi:hypothetical protein
MDKIIRKANPGKQSAKGVNNVLRNQATEPSHRHQGRESLLQWGMVCLPKKGIYSLGELVVHMDHWRKKTWAVLLCWISRLTTVSPPFSMHTSGTPSTLEVEDTSHLRGQNVIVSPHLMVEFEEQTLRAL